jgi:hypothetical protein
MRKRLQVFISSTFTDLQEERQSAVEAILNAGHIPAGMELFKAGNESQLDTICRWIDESDIYMLILGGRYGSLEPISQLSYTQLEYEYALQKGIPVFAVVLKDEALDKKLQVLGRNVLERDNVPKYDSFKELVLSKICKFVLDEKDIKLAILETLNEFQQLFEFTGWISGRDIPKTDDLVKEIIALRKENEKLLKIAEKEKALREKYDNSINGYTIEQIAQKLKDSRIVIKGDYLGKDEDLETNLLDAFIRYRKKLATGIENSYGTKQLELYLYYQVASELLIYGFMEKVKVAGVKYERMQTTKLGNKFLMEYDLVTV